MNSQRGKEEQARQGKVRGASMGLPREYFQSLKTKEGALGESGVPDVGESLILPVAGCPPPWLGVPSLPSHTVRSHYKHISLQARGGAHVLIMRTKFGKRRKVRTAPLDCQRIRTFVPQERAKIVRAHFKRAENRPHFKKVLSPKKTDKTRDKKGETIGLFAY